jgi:hypothetical protein
MLGVQYSRRRGKRLAGTKATMSGLENRGFEAEDAGTFSQVSHFVLSFALSPVR